MEPHRCSLCVKAKMLRIKLHPLLNYIHFQIMELNFWCIFKALLSFYYCGTIHSSQKKKIA